jgi:hypothetical protein
MNARPVASSLHERHFFANREGQPPSHLRLQVLADLRNPEVMNFSPQRRVVEWNGLEDHGSSLLVGLNADKPPGLAAAGGERFR